MASLDTIGGMDTENLIAAVARARQYPFSRPVGSYLFTGNGVMPFDPLVPGSDAVLEGRVPILAYGSNSSPDALARKFGHLPGVRIPVTTCRLEGFDAVYSRHFYNGYIPATLAATPDTALHAHLNWLGPEEMEVMNGTEHLGLNYELGRLDQGVARLESGLPVMRPYAYRGLHGQLELDGRPVAVTGTSSENRHLRQLDQDGILEQARAAVAPDLTLEEMVAAVIESPERADDLTVALKRAFPNR